MSGTFDYFYKLLLVGDQYTGKTSLLRRFADDNFQSSYLHTIGIDFKIKTVELNGKRIRLQLWDTAGQERFKSITSSYYRGAQGILLVYDICDRQSFHNIRNWVTDIRESGVGNVEKILVGNKSDLAHCRSIYVEEGRQLASVIGARFIETSAKEGTNVERVVITLVENITARKYANTSIYQNGTLDRYIAIKTNQRRKSPEGKGGTLRYQSVNPVHSVASQKQQLLVTPVKPDLHSSLLSPNPHQKKQRRNRKPCCRF